VTEDLVYYQEWRQGEVTNDELDKGMANSVLLGKRQEFEEENADWSVENVLKRKWDSPQSHEHLYNQHANKRQRL